jgi:predicted NBD/HSP70 family sugar kinase
VKSNQIRQGSAIEEPSRAGHHPTGRASAENTKSAILDLIRSSGTVSRVELAEMTGLTQPSIGRSVKSLIDAGLVIETGLGQSTGGKRPSLLALSANSRVAVGLSLDVATLTYVVTDLAGTVIGRRLSRGIEQTPPQEVVLRVAEELTELLDELELPLSQVVGVGIAGGGLDIRGSEVGQSLRADDWESFALVDALQQIVGVPVLRDNDAACAALGQYWAGRVPATQDFATLYMSNGFGIGLMLGGRPSRGTSSNLGEIGHMIVDIDGPDCWCGSRGCLEVLAGPGAVVAEAVADPELVEELGITGAEADLRHDFDAVARAATDGDVRCEILIDRSARYVAAAMLSVVNLLDLDLVYLAGPGFAGAADFYARRIDEVVARNARTAHIHGVTVEVSDPGLDTAAIGAASLALQHVLTPHTRPARAVTSQSGVRKDS